MVACVVAILMSHTIHVCNKYLVTLIYIFVREIRLCKYDLIPRYNANEI